ncbi:MAG: DUF4132 domain-containing protein [Armatimonadota bacterium]
MRNQLTQADAAADTHSRRLDQPELTRLLALISQVWPEGQRSAPVAGLPSEVVEALVPRHRRSPVGRAARHLDRHLPGWPELAARLVVGLAGRLPNDTLRRLGGLLSRRRLSDPTPLIQVASTTDSLDTKLWALAALVGSDTPDIRSFWLHDLRRQVRAEVGEPGPALWLSFVRAFLGGWLTYADFRNCLLQGRAMMVPAAGGDYRPALAKLGLDRHPTFAKWYRQVVYEIAHQPDVSLSYAAGGWIRDFPGEDYLWEALASLGQRADAWWPLHVVRWTTGVAASDPRTISRLCEAPPLVLCLLSLLRPDLLDAVESAAGAPHHAEAVRWLTTASPAKALDFRALESRIRPWAEQLGEPMALACGALCSVEPPDDSPGGEDLMLRRREWLRALLPGFDRVMENVSCLHALRKEHLDYLFRQARSGQAGAIRALSLWPEMAERTAPLLFRLGREGTQSARRAARESLEVLRAQAKAHDLVELERRVDLAAAWADGGLDGRPAQVWWDIAGYRVKLSIASGRVALDIFSGTQRMAGIPRAVRRAPEYEDVRRARTELSRNYRYFRSRFEAAMVEGARFSGQSFGALLVNPVVRSLASRLVLLVDGAPLVWGPTDPLDEEAPTAQFAGAGEIAIAHPLALARLGALSVHQQRVISEGISQPFKQVFREVYAVGEEEREARSCARFAGHALVARQAFALLRSRGYSPRRGEAVKELPTQPLVAHLRWAADDEDAGRLLSLTETDQTVTSGAVWFEEAPGRIRPLGEVDPIALSETLRDADLLVSRAAAGDVGFTSGETLRLRATLVRCLARLLELTTVYVSDEAAHVLVDGRRALYRVHLGSGSVLLEESRRHLDLGQVHAQAIADLLGEGMDAGTARVLAIVQTLARDDEIGDPAFLRQLA